MKNKKIGVSKKEIVYPGDTIKTASRICSSAHMLGKSILISKAVHDKLNTENDVVFDDLGEHSFKGKSEKIHITSGIWFTMQSEKIKVISEAKKLLLNAMDERAKKVQDESLQVLIITFIIWIIAVILGILGYLLSYEISSNIKNLENVLKKVAEDTFSKNSKINLNTSNETNQAYELIVKII